MSAPAGNPNDRDYLDKGLDAAEKKFGGARFQGADSVQKNRAMNEKITDFIRKGLEKITGFVTFPSSIFLVCFSLRCTGYVEGQSKGEGKSFRCYR